MTKIEIPKEVWYIKTGYDIEDDMRRGIDAYDREGQKQWVSLSWLKEQIEYRKLNRNGEQRAALDWVLSLLEVK